MWKLRRLKEKIDLFRNTFLVSQSMKNLECGILKDNHNLQSRRQTLFNDCSTLEEQNVSLNPDVFFLGYLRLMKKLFYLKS